MVTDYLNNQEAVNAYLRKQAEEAEQVRRKIEAKRPEIFELETRLRERI